jgi:F-type H+-transporting ATPase subunit b
VALPVAPFELASLLGPSGAEPEGALQKILAQMPDPMRPNLYEIGFVVLLVTLFYLYLRVVFFKPITKVMDDRDRDLNAGSDTKNQAAALVEARQKDYNERLKELRAKAFAHKKALADAASVEKQRMLDEARAKATSHRQAAVESLKADAAKAKQDLIAQVDSLAESMVKHLLKQA